VRGLRGLFSFFVYKIIALYKEVFLQKSKEQRAKKEPLIIRSSFFIVQILLRKSTHLSFPISFFH